MDDRCSRYDAAVTQTLGLRERQKADRRERILNAALELIGERGFPAATFDAIAQRAAVSRGTVFNYFPYKESILVAYFAGELDELAQQVNERRTAAPAWPVEDELEYLFGRLAEFVESRRELILPLSYELLNPDPERSRAAYLALPLAELLKGSLERGRAQGRVRSDYSLERLARTLANTYFITTLQWAAYRSDRSVADELSVAVKLTLEGLAAS